MPNSRSFVPFALLLVGFSACRSKPEPSEPAAKSVASVAPAAASVATPAPASALPAALPESEARSLVARWEAAQNDGKFQEYSDLYAERFMGVKRVGTYSKRFDRASWLADRKPMFEGRAKVKVTGLELVAAPGATRAVFTQEFTSTGFRDVGKKELFLVPSAGGIVISREEMLDSQVSGESAAGDAVLAYHRDGVVLERGFDKSKLASPPRLLSAPNASPIQIAFDVAPAAVTEASRAWLGRAVTAYTTAGETCSGKVARFEVRVQAVPHFGMRQGWNGERDQPKAKPEEVAQAIERMAQRDEHFVVGVLDGACAGSWATAAPRPFTRATPAQGALREAGIAAFRALPGYAALQKKFVKEAEDSTKSWDSVNGELSVTELPSPGGPSLLLVSARSGGGCAGFNGSLSALWRASTSAGAPKLEALKPAFEEFITLRGALDLGSESGLALLAGPDSYDDQVSVIRLSPKASRRVVFSTSFWDCDC